MCGQAWASAGIFHGGEKYFRGKKLKFMARGLITKELKTKIES